MLPLVSAGALAFTTVTTLNASALLAQGFFSLVIDVRRLDEYESTTWTSPAHPPGHLAGAYLIDSLASTHIVPNNILGCRSCNVAVYCRNGSRTQGAAPWLEAAGFTNVYDIVGVLPWYNAGLPLEIGNLTLPQSAPACNTSSICSAAAGWVQQPDDDSTSYMWAAPVAVGAFALVVAAAVWQIRRSKMAGSPDGKLPSVGGSSAVA